MGNLGGRELDSVSGAEEESEEAEVSVNVAGLVSPNVISIADIKAGVGAVSAMKAEIKIHVGVWGWEAAEEFDFICECVAIGAA